MSGRSSFAAVAAVAASLGFGVDLHRGSYDSIQRDPKLMCYVRSDQGDAEVWFQPGHGAPDARSIDPQAHLSVRTETVDGRQVTLGVGEGGYCVAEWNPPSNRKLLVGTDLGSTGEDGPTACQQLAPLITATVDALHG